MPKIRTCKEIAADIDQCLKKFEGDLIINAKKLNGFSSYWGARAWASGRWVVIRYVSYQGMSNLTKQDAEKYLSWLQAGNIGKHYSCLPMKSIIKGYCHDNEK
jgi:hypothetical protein